MAEINDDLLDLHERKALNWFRVNGPAEISAPGMPQRFLRVALIRRGLVQIVPVQQRFTDNIRYGITEKGLEWLKT